MPNFLHSPLWIPTPRSSRIGREIPRVDLQAFRPTVAQDADTLIAAENDHAGKLLAGKIAQLCPEGEEGYSMVTDAGGWALRWNQLAGKRHALGSLDAARASLDGDRWAELEIQDSPTLPVRGIHMDFKYGLPDLDYLRSWLEKMAKWRFNTILIEYEDRFPFDRYGYLQHPEAFGRAPLKEILRFARSLGFRLVPLVPTLGHLEFALRHPRLSHLAAGDYLTEIDLGKPEALTFVLQLIEEFLQLHEEDEWLHIGGDESWRILRLMASQPELAAKVYTDHISLICDFVLKAGKRPLLFDDVLRSLPESAMKDSLDRLPSQTVLTVWHYNSSHVGRGSPKEKIREALRSYAEAGKEFLLMPCHNWGPCVPYYADFCRDNIVEMISLGLEEGALGAISTSWAVFATPWPLTDYGAALAADRLWSGDCQRSTRAFDEAFCWEEFGLLDRRPLDALLQMDAMIEIATDLGRPVHLPHFYYMDAVLHFGGQDLREKLGPVIPRGGLDYAIIAQQKIDLLESSPVRVQAISALRRLKASSQIVLATLEGLLREAPRGQRTLELYAAFAEFRQFASRRMLFLAGEEEGSPTEMLTRGQLVRARLAASLSWCMAPGHRKDLLESLFSGEDALLHQLPRKRRSSVAPPVAATHAA